jgi:hypothetical protein
MKCIFTTGNKKKININNEVFPHFISTRRYMLMVKGEDQYCDCPACWRHAYIKCDRSWKRHRRTQWRNATTAE